MSIVKFIIFCDWFVDKFYLILKCPKLFFIQNNGNKFNNQSLLFGIVCMFIGLGGKNFIEILFLNWSELIFNSTPENFITFKKIFFIYNYDYVIKFFHFLYILKWQRIINILILPLFSYIYIMVFAVCIYCILKFFYKYLERYFTYKKILNIVCFCQAPMLFLLIPFISLFIYCWISILLLKSCRELYYHYFVYNFFIIIIVMMFLKSILTFFVNICVLLFI